MSKINIRSPYFVTQSDAGLESLQIELWVYTGTRTPSTYPTTDPTYTLTTTAIDDSATFEVSELIKDYLDSSFGGTYTSSAVFVDYRLTKTVSGVTSTVPQVYQKEAYDGYGYFSDGANPQNRNALLVSSPTIYKMKDEVLTLPYNVGTDLSVNFSVTAPSQFVSNPTDGYAYSGQYYIYGSDLFQNGTPSVGEIIELSDNNSSTFLYSGTIQSVDTSLNRIYFSNLNALGSFTDYRYTTTLSTTSFDSSNATNESSDIIEYFSSPNTFKAISTTDGVSTIHNVVEIEECRNTPYKLTFVNKFGALEDIWFYGASKETTSTSKEDYKSNIVTAGSYSINEHQRKILNKNGVDSMVINSNFYPEEHNETFKQLFLSEKVWITYKTQVLPIHIASNAISYKNRLNDKLINYEINIEFSNNNINNIR